MIIFQTELSKLRICIYIKWIVCKVWGNKNRESPDDRRKWGRTAEAESFFFKPADNHTIYTKTKLPILWNEPDVVNNITAITDRLFQ